jgi:hypothetical protein
MLRAILGVHGGLFASSRVWTLTRPERAVSWLEVALLMLLGAGTALAVGLTDFNLRIPGHAIVCAVFPMALGLAVVPRRSGGCIMGLSALATALGLRAAGAMTVGVAALTSMTLTGPLLDLALWGARRGWRLYLGFVLAGLGGNLAAFFVRWSFRAIDAIPPGSGGGRGGGGGLGGGGRRMAEWLALAPWTYPVCGVLAGLVSALVWFHFRGRRRPEDAPRPAA